MIMKGQSQAGQWWWAEGCSAGPAHSGLESAAGPQAAPCVLRAVDVDVTLDLNLCGLSL